MLTLVARVHDKGSAPYIYPHSGAFYERNLSGEASNWLAVDGERLVGYAALRRLDDRPDYVDDSDFAAESGLLLYSLVDPGCRVRGLGKRLAQARVEHAEQVGLRWLYSTVHPDNEPMMRILLGLGFRVITQKPMFSQQLMRNLLALELR